MNPDGENQQPQRPVAYDANGQPLYAAPPPPVPPQGSIVLSKPVAHEGHNFDPRMRSQYGNEPDVVHHSRQYEPRIEPVSEDLRAQHEESKRRFPDLNLSEGEFVIKSITRHPIGILTPMVATITLILVLLIALIAYPVVAADPTGEVPYLLPMTTVILCLIVLIGIGGYIAVWVYLKNAFYLTNESVIQEIQHSLFARNEQTVSLGSIEDASYKQVGILQTTFNFGTIRLSTEGDDTTYRFTFVDSPKEQIAILNNAIEAFKNGRPVTGIRQD